MWVVKAGTRFGSEGVRLQAGCALCWELHSLWEASLAMALREIQEGRMGTGQTQQQSSLCAGAVGLAVLGEPLQRALGIGTLKNFKKIFSDEK